MVHEERKEEEIRPGGAFSFGKHQFAQRELDAITAV